MKLKGIFGKGTGKVGSSVFAVSGGEQIVREYNPKVSNPQTNAQVEQRAKFKLLSQIAAALASIIAFSKKGLISARNQFVSANFGAVDYSNGKASIPVTDLTLTGSITPFPDVVGSPSNGNTQNVHLDGNPDSSVDAVIYACVKVNDDEKLVVASQKLVQKENENANFATALANCASEDFIFAYGVTFSNASDKIRFENYIASEETGDATLMVENTLKMSGATFTETSAGTIA